MDGAPAVATSLDRGRLATFAGRRLDADPADVRLSVQPLRGGLESTAVARVRAWAPGRPGHVDFVVKHLQGRWRREAELYRAMDVAGLATPAPRLLGVDADPSDGTYLYLEFVAPGRTWPWVEASMAARVLQDLARLHVSVPADLVRGLDPAWDYEADLLESAAATFETFQRAAAHDGLAWLRPARGSLRRTIDVLPTMRAALRSAAPFGEAVLHGDVHSANVVLRENAEATRAVFLDWARARVGSPLEDVSSWLQSLGYWEPEARRRHDTLIRRYLVARGADDALSRPLRDAYWLASASNVLAGALRYHLAVAEIGRAHV